jgi:hypothetical protein
MRQRTREFLKDRLQRYREDYGTSYISVLEPHMATEPARTRALADLDQPMSVEDLAERGGAASPLR